MKALPKVTLLVAVIGVIAPQVFSHIHIFSPISSGEAAPEPHLGMQIVVTIAVGAAALFVILAKRYGPKDKHWAYATVGTILGYWLKG